MAGKKSFGDFSNSVVKQDDQPSVAIVGMNSDRSSVVKVVPRDGFQQSLGAALTAVHQSILPTLNQDFDGGPALSCSQAVSSESPEWSLRTVGVGVGMSAKVGLGPIWNVTISPRVRLIFTNSTNPVYPD